MSGDAPATQPGSELVPPMRRPPTAVGTEELPPPEPRRRLPRRRPRHSPSPIRRLLLRALDLADALVEAIQGERR